MTILNILIWLFAVGAIAVSVAFFILIVGAIVKQVLRIMGR